MSETKIPYQYQEEFIEDLRHPENDFENNENSKQEDKATPEKIVNKDDVINTNEENNLKED